MVRKFGLIADNAVYSVKSNYDDNAESKSEQPYGQMADNQSSAPIGAVGWSSEMSRSLFNLSVAAASGGFTVLQRHKSDS